MEEIKMNSKRLIS